MAVSNTRPQHNPPEPGSDRGNLGPRDLGDGTHTHDVSAEQIAHASRVVVSKRFTNVDGSRLVYSENPMLPCCGRSLASLTVDEVVADV